MKREESLTIRYPGFRDRLKILESCLTSVIDDDREPESKLFISPSGGGKSTLLETFQKDHPIKELGSRLEMNVAIVEVPTKPSVKSFAERILYTLHDPLWDKGNTIAKGVRIREICERCAVRVLAFDDFHHLMDARSDVPYDAAEFLKEMLVETQKAKRKISVVAFGLKRSRNVLLANEQLRRRFDKPIEFGVLRLEVKEEREDYLSVLKSFREAVPGYEIPKCDSEKFPLRIHYASYGLPGYTLKILRRAVKIARRRHKSELSMDIMSDAYSEVIFEEDAKVPNPFTSDFDYEKAPRREPPIEQEPSAKAAVKPSRRRGRLKLAA